MARRKYKEYIVHADFGKVNKTMDSYREAYSLFCSERWKRNPATIIGRKFDGSPKVIFSRG